MGFLNISFLTSLKDIPNFSQGIMFKNGPNWKDTHLYVAPLYSKTS